MDNRDAMWPLQVAIHERLTADELLMADVTGIFDSVPPRSQFPYVSIGAMTSTPSGAHDRFGARVIVTLHGWSTYRGHKEISAIAGHLLRILDHQALTAEGHHTVYVHHQQTVTQTEQSNDIRHVSCRFAIETENAA